MKLTYDEYYALPDDGKWYEVIDGVLSLRPTPNIKHQTIGGNILLALGTYLEERPVGEACLPLDVVLSDTNVVQPDLLFVSKRAARRIHRRLYTRRLTIRIHRRVAMSHADLFEN